MKTIHICSRATYILHFNNLNLPTLLLGEDDADRFIDINKSNIFHMMFDDIYGIKDNYKRRLDYLSRHISKPLIFPTRVHVESALDWAENKDELVSCCQAGVSRSSAMGFLIACKYNGINNAINLLDRRLHYPNDLIVKTGSEILNDTKVWSAYKDWIDEL